MTTRKGFFAAILGTCGLARAQKLENKSVGPPIVYDRFANLRPNQCPVCGTIAQPLQPQDSPFGGWRLNIHAQRFEETGNPANKGLDAGITRCVRCKQDAEQPKAK